MGDSTMASQIQLTHKRLCDVARVEAELQKQLEYTLIKRETSMQSALEEVERKHDMLKQEQANMRTQLLELPGDQSINLNSYEIATDQEMLRPLPTWEIMVDVLESDVPIVDFGVKKKTKKFKGRISRVEYAEEIGPERPVEEVLENLEPWTIKREKITVSSDERTNRICNKLRDLAGEREILAKRLSRLFIDQEKVVKEEIEKAKRQMDIFKDEGEKIRRDFLRRGNDASGQLEVLRGPFHKAIRLNVP